MYWRQVKFCSVCKRTIRWIEFSSCVRPHRVHTNTWFTSGRSRHISANTHNWIIFDSMDFALCYVIVNTPDALNEFLVASQSYCLSGMDEDIYEMDCVIRVTMLYPQEIDRGRERDLIHGEPANCLRSWNDEIMKHAAFHGALHAWTTILKHINVCVWCSHSNRVPHTFNHFFFVYTRAVCCFRYQTMNERTIMCRQMETCTQHIRTTNVLPRCSFQTYFSTLYHILLS